MSSTVLIALGSNLGDRNYNLRRAIDALRNPIRLVRLSPVIESAAVDSPVGAPAYLNMVAAGITALAPDMLLRELLAIERGLGRKRSGLRNEPRLIDLDLILYGSRIMRTSELTLPHPRFMQREFVLAPMRALELGWHDPASGLAIDRSANYQM